MTIQNINRQTFLRGFRFVLLAVCLLAVVLQPLSVYATLDYTGAIGYNCVPYNQAPTDVLNFINGQYNNLPNYISTSAKNFVIQYNSLSGIMYVYVSNATQSELLLFAQTTNNNDKLKFYRPYSGAYQTVTVSCYSYSTPQSSLPSASTRADLITNNPNDLWYLVLSPTAVNQYGSSLFVEGSGSGSGGTDDPGDWDPNAPSGYTLVYDPNLYYQIGLMLSSNFNCYTPDGSTHFNPNWIGVGQALTYDYLCKTQKSSPNVNVTMADGTTVSLANYLYGEPDYTQSIADITGLLTTINSRVNTTNTRLNTLNTHLTNKLDPITADIAEFTDKFNDVFPDETIALRNDANDIIENDTNGNGLTIAKVRTAKTVIDDAGTSFKLSNEEPGTAFTAINNSENWIFFSTGIYNSLTGTDNSYLDLFGEGELASDPEHMTYDLTYLDSLRNEYEEKVRANRND